MNWLETQMKAIDAQGHKTCTVELLKEAMRYAYVKGLEDGYQEGYGDGFQSSQVEICE